LRQHRVLAAVARQKAIRQVGHAGHAADRASAEDKSAYAASAAHRRADAQLTTLAVRYRARHKRAIRRYQQAKSEQSEGLGLERAH
jgi:hypothetical protein